MSLKPVLPGGFVQVPASVGGFSLPFWMFDAADNSSPDPHCFTTDNINSAAFGTIKINDVDVPGSNYANFFGLIPIATWLVLINTKTGIAISFQVSSTTHDAAGFTIYTVVGTSQNVGSFSGEYAISMWPVYAPTLAAVLTQSALVPAPDGVYSLPTSITISQGIITAIS